MRYKSKPREFWILKANIDNGDAVVDEEPDYSNLFYKAINIAEYDKLAKSNEILREALVEMLDHVCDGSGEKPCSQMWFQDVAEDTLRKVDELLK